MSFELYTRDYGGQHFGMRGITISAKGAIFFTSGFRDKYHPEQYKMAELYVDNANQLIALKFSNGERTNHNAPLRSNGYHAGSMIVSLSFARTAIGFGYPVKYDLQVKEVDGLLVVEKPLKGGHE